MNAVGPITGRDEGAPWTLTERLGGACTFVTFYSFKGGVGRSRTVANAAYELAHRGYDVLMIDFDLEAPDLTSYFAPWYPDGALDNRQGLVDMITSLRKALTTRDPLFAVPLWQSYVSRLEGFEHPRDGRVGRMDLMTAGRQDTDYPKRVADIDWSAFYEQFDGGLFIEYLRREMARRYDFVLIDSRTGFADISGICTIQLADIIVPMFTASRSSVSGVETVVGSARRQHRLLERSRPLKVIPLPARIDLDVRAEDRKIWMDWLCKQKVANWIREVAPEVSAEQGFQQVMLYYQRQFSFRAEMECYVEDVTGQTEANSRQYRQIVDLVLRASEAPAVRPRRPSPQAIVPLEATTGVSRGDRGDLGLAPFAQHWRNPVERDFVEGLGSFAWSVGREETARSLQLLQGRFAQVSLRVDEEGGGELDLPFAR
jgi:cellulose biosynthesis protein BcsQ